MSLWLEEIVTVEEEKENKINWENTSTSDSNVPSKNAETEEN